MDYQKLYADFLKQYWQPKRPLRVVFDSSNGTTGLVLKKLFADKQMSVETVFLNAGPDGNFPAHGPNPMAKGALDQLGLEVTKTTSDFGAAFDADGDRVFFVDNLGRPLEPAATTILLATRCKKGDVVMPANMGPFVRRELAKKGHRILDSRVGHYFVKKLMKEKKLAFGSEQSGHYYFQKFFDLDSGIFAAIEFADALSELPGTLAEWIDQLPPHWISKEINFEVQDKEVAMARIRERYGAVATRATDIDGVSMEFSDWWINVRPSNTENLLRLNLEADSKTLFDAKLKEFYQLLSG